MLRALLILAVLAGGSSAFAEPIRGRIIDGQSLDPISGAEIVGPKGDRVASDSQGYFRLEAPIGQLRLRVRATGYELGQERLHVTEGGVRGVVFVLFDLAAQGELIEVHGKRRPPARVPPGKQEITREEITRIPGTRGDALQGVKSLPGVANATAIGSGPGQIVVRGAAPEDSKITIDGISVPLLYHFFGFQSILPSEFIDSIEYMPGGFGAEEGNATGGVINVKTRQIDAETTKGFAEVSFVNLAGMVQGPISKKHNLTYAIAARRSLIDFVLPAVIPDDVNLSFLTAPIYYDGQVRVDWRPKYSDRVSFFLMGSSDEMKLLNNEISPNEPEITGGIENVTRFMRPILSWHHETEQFESTVAGSMGMGGFRLDLGPDRFFDFTGFSMQLRADQVWKPHKRIDVRTGLDAIRRTADIRSKFPLAPGEGTGGMPNFSTAPLVEIDEAFTDDSMGGYLALDLHVGPDTTVSPGIRLDYYRRYAAAAWAPRLAVQHTFSEKLLGRFVMGSYNRSAEQSESFTTSLRPELATQYVLGGEYNVARGWQLQSSLYYTDRRQLIGQDPELAASDPKNSYINIGYGRSMGAETTLRAQRGGFFGWLTYSLSKSDRVDTPIGDRRLFDYDQTHNLVVLGSYKLGKWQFGGRFQWSTGRPLTPVVGARYLSDVNIYLPELGEINSDRFANDHQLDLRIDRKWEFEKWKLELYLDVTNVYAHARLLGYSHNFDYSERFPITEVPILPALGFRGTY